MISSVCSFLFSLILGNPFPFIGAQLRRKGILTFLAQISTSRGGRFLVLPRRTPDAEQVNLLLRAWRSTEATTLRGPERLTDRAAKPAEGGPGAAGTLRGAAGDPGAAQCGARLRPAAPFFHPLPLPTPTARSILSLPSPRLHQSRPAEGLPPGRGTRGRALPPPWASRHSGAPGPSGSSLSPSISHEVMGPDCFGPHLISLCHSLPYPWKVKVKSLSCVRLLVTPWTAAYQTHPSMGFSRQEYWSGVPLPSPC